MTEISKPIGYMLRGPTASDNGSIEMLFSEQLGRKISIESEAPFGDGGSRYEFSDGSVAYRIPAHQLASRPFGRSVAANEPSGWDDDIALPPAGTQE